MSVLVSSAGRRVALVETFRSVLAGLGLPPRVVAADMSPLSAACAAADYAVRVPPCSEPDFIPTMLEVCRQEGVRLVVPTIDTELPAFAAARADFAAIGTLVAVSSREVVRIAGDKRLTHDHLVRSGLPTVEQAEVDSALSAGWGFPLVVKPVDGSASEGVHIVRTHAAFAAATESGDVIVQRLAPGNEYTVDCLVDDSGQMLGAVPRRRLAVRGGEVSKGRTEQRRELTAVTAAVCASLPGAFGVLNVQMFLDPADERVSIIEINPRFGGGYPLTHAAGAPFAQWLVERAWDRCSDLDMSWQGDIVMLRYDEAVYLDRDGQLIS